GGIFEIAAHRHLNLFAGVQQPENDKQCHHGRDKVGVGDLPGAAVMAAVAALFLQDDDGTRFIHDVCTLSKAQADAADAAAAAPPPRQAFSSSWKEGRTWPGIARRAVSTAMMGALPFRKETINTRSTARNACSSSAALAMLAATGPTRP